jgi:sugar lactone lactonase YvrE
VAASPNTVNNGTVVRIDLLTLPGIKPIVLDERVIANGFPERTDPAALVVGPTGVGLGRDGTLYVADTDGNRIAAVPNALFRGTPVTGGGTTVTSGGSLMGPLGLTIAPNGDVLTTNGGDGNLVETTPGGMQVATATLDSTVGAGALFGLTVPPGGNGVLYVDDGDNTLRLFH